MLLIHLLINELNYAFSAYFPKWLFHLQISIPAITSHLGVGAGCELLGAEESKGSIYLFHNCSNFCLPAESYTLDLTFLSSRWCLLTAYLLQFYQFPICCFWLQQFYLQISSGDFSIAGVSHTKKHSYFKSFLSLLPWYCWITLLPGLNLMGTVDLFQYMLVSGWGKLNNCF